MCLSCRFDSVASTVCPVVAVAVVLFVINYAQLLFKLDYA